MSLGLHPRCQTRLKQLLAEILTRVKVNHNTFLEFPSTLELLSAQAALPETGPVREQIEKYIGEDPLFSFIYHSLSRELLENGTYDSERTGTPLQEFHDYADLAAVAERLIDDFESLPWSYLISYELPKKVGEPLRRMVDSHSLTDSIGLVAPDETHERTYPFEEGRRLTAGLLGEPQGWNKENLYLQIAAKGFIGLHGKTMPLEEAIGTLKSFVGLSLATRLIRVGREEHRALALGAAPKSWLVVHRKLDDAWQVCSRYDLPSDLSATLVRLEIDDIDGRFEGEGLDKWMRSRFHIISIAFQNPDKAERVLLAAQWLLDSYVGFNELLSFVQTTVAMEIMLGEESKSDVIGINELLRNRCAYLIGKSHSQREEILKDFNKIYDVRSKIVHRGKSQLTSEERSLFWKLQWMCRRVISEELNLISEDIGR
jgi:hypothetical protein